MANHLIPRVCILGFVMLEKIEVVCDDAKESRIWVIGSWACSFQSGLRLLFWIGDEAGVGWNERTSCPGHPSYDAA
jgi:hypothetical protein